MRNYNNLPMSSPSPAGILILSRLLLALFSLLLLLTACGPPASGLSNVTASTDMIVPGSSGIGNPPGTVEVRYTLGSAGPVTARLEGPVSSELLSETQEAGDHILRFNGVITASESLDGYFIVRRAVPEGDYTIAIAAGGMSQSVRFQVGASDTEPPALGNIVVRPDTISPNSDAVDDVAEVTFRTNQTATLSLDLTAPDGTRTPAFAPLERGPGEQNIVVSGQDATGEILPDGTYTMTIRAQDEAGNRVEAQQPLRIEAGGEPAVAILKVDISPQQITLGSSISVSVTVKNVGDVPLRTQGPDPGYTYTTNDSYSSIEGNKWTDKAGLWRVGVDWDGNSGSGGPYRYPFRWGFGKTLMPGETVVTGGKIVILKQERKMWFFVGVLQEGIRIALDRLGRTAVNVDF